MKRRGCVIHRVVPLLPESWVSEISVSIPLLALGRCIPDGGENRPGALGSGADNFGYAVVIIRIDNFEYHLRSAPS